MVAIVHVATPEEWAAGSLSAEALHAVTQSLQVDGFAVVGGLVRSETCKVLAASVLGRERSLHSEQLRTASRRTTPVSRRRGFAT